MSSDGSSDFQMVSKDEVGTTRRHGENRKPRNPDAVAGPSNIHTAATKLKRRSKSKNKSSGSATPIPLLERKSPAIMEEPSFENNGDFIAFEPDDSLEDRDQHPREDKEGAREREWDKGKGKARERDGGGGKKRKADFDQNDGYNNKKERTNAASRKAPWVADVDWEGSANVAELLHREVEAFAKYISPTPEEDEIRSLVVALISQAISNRFPDAKVLAFGSYETKLYLPLGDIDLVVISQSMLISDRVTVLHALANTLKRSGITDKVTIIAKAKVPIIKFVTTHGLFPVDISLNQQNGVEAGRVVSGFLSEMPALRALVLVAKAFLSQRSMNEVFSGGLGSYSIVCLAVSFLQMHPKIRRGEIDPSQNLGVLVMEFFEYYGTYFNYQEVGISLRDGGTYFSKARRGWMDYKQGLLSIEDPADIKNDISKGSYNIARVRQTFAGAHEIMIAAAYTKAGVLNSRRSGRSVSLRGYEEPTDLSILSSVLGVTQETINRRRIVQEVYDKRALHRLVGVQPRATVTQGTPHLNGIVRSNGGGVIAVQTAWEPTERSQEAEDEESARKPEPSAKARSQEVIDVDTEEEESRYEIPRKRRRKINEVMDAAETIFTTDDGSGDSDVIIVESSDEEEEEYGDGTNSLKGGFVKINRKRAFWASKGGTGAGTAGLGT